MPRVKKTRQNQDKREFPGPILTLSLWQLRQTWRLLLVVGAGVLTAIMLVCAIPLYTQVAQSAALRHTLTTNPQDSYIRVTAFNSPLDKYVNLQVEQNIAYELETDLGSAIAQTPVVSVVMPPLVSGPHSVIEMVGMDVKSLPQHARLVEGRFPRSGSGHTFEVALTPEAARAVQLHVGSTVRLKVTTRNLKTLKLQAAYFTLSLVGLFTQSSQNDPFWHSSSFQPAHYEPDPTPGKCNCANEAQALVPNDQLTDALHFLGLDKTPFILPTQVNWYYSFDLSQISIDQLDNLITGVQLAEEHISGLASLSVNSTPTSSFLQPPNVTQINAFGPLNGLLDLRGRLTVLSLPLESMTYLVAGLVLFFVIQATNLLVERQVAAITLLRSRGASRRQLFGALAAQSAVLTVLALLVGPWLAAVLAILLARVALNANDQVAVSVLTNHLLAAVGGTIKTALALATLCLLSMVFTSWQSMRANILTLRQEAARATSQPLWLRFKLDLVAATIALVGCGFLWYLNTSGILDVRTHVLIMPLAMLVGVLFLLVAGLLVLLRVFPALLRLGNRLTLRRRGAAPMLALAHMARSPRQSLRMTLLFALAMAFALFTLVFAQTQRTRLTDLATFQVGTDFSGTLPVESFGSQWNQLQDEYRQIPGVTSATVGYTTVAGSKESGLLVDLLALDAGSYASTVYWSDPGSYAALQSFMSELVAQRTAAGQARVVPAVIDQSAAQTFNLKVGGTFALIDTQDVQNQLTYKVIGIVPYLPTVNDGQGYAGTQQAALQGGVLVDFATFAQASESVNGDDVFPTGVWLRANPAQVASVRQGLSQNGLQLRDVNDLLAIASQDDQDPLYGAVIGVLIVGVIIALLLGLLGNLLAFWLSVHARMTNFALLRALGCAPRQVASVLVWEQSIIYLVALALGGLAGSLLIWLVLPGFIFSPVIASASVDTSNLNQFYQAQLLPPVHQVVPIWSLGGAILGVVGACSLVIGLTIFLLSRISLSQMLRLSED